MRRAKDSSASAASRGFRNSICATKINAADVAKLQSALPNCKITVDPAIQAELDKMKKR